MRGRVEAEVSGDGVSVRVAGELDLRVEPRLRAVVTDALDRGSSLVLLDLADVSFIDCAGVAALMAARDDVRQRGGELQVRSASRRVTRLLALTETDRRLCLTA